jgi:hypothetical protein
MTVIQSLPLTIGLESKRLIVLDTLRRQRNVADYTGDDVDVTTAEHCITEAGRLIEDVAAWRASKRPRSRPAEEEVMGDARRREATPTQCKFSAVRYSYAPVHSPAHFLALSARILGAINQ